MGLRGYLIRRILLSLFVLYLVVTFNFIIFSIQKGSPVDYILDPKIEPEAREKLKEALGYYDPWYIKYAKYLRNMFTFGIIYPYFGVSITTSRYIAHDMAWRLGITVCLLGSALIGSILVGIPLGAFAALKRGGKSDVGLVGLALFTWGVPGFFIQLLAIALFGKVLRDTYGINIFKTHWTPPLIREKNLQWWAGALSQLALPILTLVLMSFGSWVLYTRNMLIDALTSDYVLTARAKGLSERTVLYKHAFKSILPPISTMITLSIPGVVTGAIITETIFGIEGIGKWYIASLQHNVADYGVTQAVLFIYSVLVILCNLIADILYGILDPRIRVGQRR